MRGRGAEEEEQDPAQPAARGGEKPQPAEARQDDQGEEGEGETCGQRWVAGPAGDCRAAGHCGEWHQGGNTGWRYLCYCLFQWISGVTPATTCQDIIQVLLQQEGLQTQASQLKRSSPLYLLPSSLPQVRAVRAVEEGGATLETWGQAAGYLAGLGAGQECGQVLAGGAHVGECDD